MATIPAGPSSSGPVSYVSVEKLRQHLGDDTSRLSADLLTDAGRTASRQVEQLCGRRFWPDSDFTTRVFRVDDPRTAWVDDFSTTEGLIVATDDRDNGAYGTAWPATAYVAEPLSADVAAAADTAAPHAFWRLVALGSRSWPYSERRAVLRLTARFGWSAIPDEVEMATALVAVRLYRRKDAPFGVAGFGEAGAVRLGRSDPDVAALLAPYIKQRPRILTYAPQRSSLFHARGWPY